MRIPACCPLVLLVLPLLCSAPPTEAGGSLLVLDFTKSEPSPNAGEVTADLVPARWDPRCIPVEFRLNDTLDPLPDPTGNLGTTPLEDARVAIEKALDSWNRIPTSFIDMRLVGTVSNPGTAHFDMVNEVTFNSNLATGILAVSTSTTACRDVVLQPGDDLDNDGDSDVSVGIETCRDVDEDGDVELPAGAYPAGTIVSNDVTFNSDVYRYTTTPDNIFLSVDVEAIAAHEFGHSHGLAHTLINQISATDPNSATMFPLIDTNDAATLTALRTLHDEEIAISSFFYPEGTATQGPAALQEGDVPFEQVFGLIEGTILDGAVGGNGGPLVGAAVTATDSKSGRVVASVFSGRARTSFNPITRQQNIVKGDPGFHFLDGDYRLPLPRGFYDIAIEAVDGTPLAAEAATDAVELSDLFGRQDFQPDKFNLFREDALETAPGHSVKVPVLPGRTLPGIDLISNREFTLATFGDLDDLSFDDADGETFYAVAFPGEALLAAAQGEPLALTAGLFFTSVCDSSVAPIFERALLTRCSVDGATARVDLKDPLREISPFVGREGDLTPFYFPNSVILGIRLAREIRSGRLSHICLVLDVPPPPYAGTSGLPPLIGVDGRPDEPQNDAPIRGLSFRSDDGGPFLASEDSNFLFGLVGTRLLE